MPRKPANPKNDTTAKKTTRRKKTAEPVVEMPVEAVETSAKADADIVSDAPAKKTRTRKPKAAADAVATEAPVKKTRGRKAKAEAVTDAAAAEAPVKKTRGRKAKAEAVTDAVAAEAPVKKPRGRKAKTETPADAPAKKPRGRKKAAPDIVAETLPLVAAETAVEDASVNIHPDIVVDVADEPLPGQLSFDGEETPAPVAETPAKKPRKPRAKKADNTPKRRGRPPKAKAPELVLTTTLQIGETELDISGIAEKAYKEYKRVHKRKIVTDFHVYVKPDEGAAYFTVNGEGSDDFKVDLT